MPLSPPLGDVTAIPELCRTRKDPLCRRLLSLHTGNSISAPVCFHRTYKESLSTAHKLHKNWASRYVYLDGLAWPRDITTFVCAGNLCETVVWKWSRRGICSHIDFHAHVGLHTHTDLHMLVLCPHSRVTRLQCWTQQKLRSLICILPSTGGSSSLPPRPAPCSGLTR